MLFRVAGVAQGSGRVGGRGGFGLYNGVIGAIGHRAQELCESRGGRPRLPVPNKPTVSVDVKHTLFRRRAQELCESRGGRPGLPVPNKPAVSVDVKQH